MANDLSSIAKANDDAKAVLENEVYGHARAVELLAGLGVETSETSVRRYRKANGVKLAVLGSPYPDNGRPVPPTGQHPDVAKWSPGITIRNGEAEVRTAFTASDQSPDHKKLLEDAGLVPEEWKITRISPLVRKDEGMVAYWFRAVPVVGGPVPTVDEMEEILAKYTQAPMLTYAGTISDRILMVPSGDLQLGKSEGGGTEATIERFARYTNQIAEELAANGGCTLLVLPWLGDCIEGIVSQHGRNLASLDMPITQQVRVYRRLMMHQIITLAPYAESLLVPVVPGNHDETTREQIMPASDSWAIEGASAAADFFRDRPGYEHIAWAFPDEGTAHLAVNIADGLTVGFTHGHGTGRSRPDQIVDWWTKQSHGRRAVGEADILVTAHWHHLRIQATGGGRTWIQIPAMDGGSGWYREKTGDDAQSGQITVDLTPGVGSGWTNLRVYS